MKDNDNRKKFRKDNLRNKHNKRPYNDEDDFYLKKANKQFKNKKKNLIDESSLEDMEDYIE